MATPAAPANGASAKPIILPKQGAARVKSVMSGDTVVLLGKPTSPGAAPPEVVFTFEGLVAPRMHSKTNPTDEPGAFEAREWLRKLVVGKLVQFETRKQGASAGDRVYGWLFVQVPVEGGDPSPLHLALECVREGHATPKSIKYPNQGKKQDDDAAEGNQEEAEQEDDYDSLLLKAYSEAKEARRGIHSIDKMPLVRSVKNATEDFECLALVNACQKAVGPSKRGIQCVIEYIFDGSRMRCQVTDPDLPDWQYSNFTLLLAGVLCPKPARTDSPAEAFSEEARNFVNTRLLQRQLEIGLVGTDKSGSCCVGIVYHPAGNIAVELLKNGLARMTDWSVRLMPTADVPALRVAENTAKRQLAGIWHSYAPPKLLSASQMRGTVVEVISGDTLLILPEGKSYDSEDALFKVSLASIRSPRVGSERVGRSDEAYSVESKERLRVLTIGKVVEVTVHYEREIPVQPGVNEMRPFGTVAVPGKHDDLSLVLIQEGLAQTQRHRDDDEKSPAYDDFRAAEAVAKAANKGLHKAAAAADGKPGAKPYKPNTVNDLTDQRKAKSYSGSLTRAGKIRAVCEFVFNGALFKLLIPSENCHVRFSPNYLRCPQPSPSPGSKQQNRPAEPFGDEAKRHARLNVLQRTIEITCSGVTNSGIITGTMKVGQGKAQTDYAVELLGAGLATLDERKVEYGEVPKYLLDAQAAAEQQKVGIWSVERKPTKAELDAAAAKTNGKTEKAIEQILKVQLSEIRSGSHFFFTKVGDEAAQVMEDSMKLFTNNHGTAGAPCDAKVGKVVAALFDDGNGKSWYRAKIVERKGPGKVSVVFLDHGNVSVVPVSSGLRPLDDSLSLARIPAVATEAVLAMVNTRPISTDEGLDAARFLQSAAWGKELTARTFCLNETGKLAVALSVAGADSTASETLNAQIVTEGLARVTGKASVEHLTNHMADANSRNSITQLHAELESSQQVARKSRSGMWRYGDIGDDDPDDL